MSTDGRESPKEESKEITAFATDRGLFHYRVLPFGIANGPSLFMRAMRKFIPYHPNIIIYLDDILIFNKDIQSHIETLKYFFIHAEKANLTLNPQKSCLENPYRA